MRTIETTVYQFNELSDKAKKKALELLRQDCYCYYANTDWHDAQETMKQVEEIAHVKCDIEESSQGFYVRWYQNTNEQYDLSDRQEFDKFKEDFERDFVSGTWSDEIICDIMKKAEFDEQRSYAGNVSWLLVDFCSEINSQTLGYFEDQQVEEYIEWNDIEFLEDGRVYNE